MAHTAAVSVFGTVIVLLICIYSSLESHTFDLIIEVLTLIWLMTLYVPSDLSFISTQFLILNLDGWFVVSSISLLFFDIPLLYYIILYYYINLRSSIICYLSS